MARITFMKLININYLTPLAKFYNYTDLGQFGLPNVFSNIPGFNNSQESNDPSSQRSSTAINDGLFITDSKGSIVFNDYFRYSFSQVFLDNYGGIVFTTCTSLILYLLAALASKCFKKEDSRIKKILIQIVHSFERSIMTTFLVSRYAYLCSALILSYAFIPLNGIYQRISFGFAILYMIVLAFILVLTICVSFYHGKNKAKLKPIRPLFGLITLLCQEYHSKRYLGRIMTFWYLLSNFLNILFLLLLRKWVIVQLSILLTLNVITILLSIPKNVFKTTTTKLMVIGTEIGFLIISILFLVMYFLESSGSYQVRLGLSWTVVGVNTAIIVFQIIVKIIEFFRLRKKKREEKKRLAKLQNEVDEDTQSQFRSVRTTDYSIDLRFKKIRIGAQRITDRSFD